MFYLQGIAGQRFHGPLEELYRTAATVRTQGVRAITQEGVEFPAAATAAGGGVHAAGLGEEAVRAYRSMLQVDQERGPLYHADQIMQRRVVTVATDDAAERAWDVLTGHGIRQAPVLDAARRVVGIVSERDLLTAFNLDHGELRDALARQVADVMISPVVCADAVTDIRRIARVMLDYGVDGVPILDENEALTGFVSRGDILRAVMVDPPLSLWR
ncbi:MAG: CBS domain-containing protein [Rhodocyclales bacterium GWA2_65_20]|nr:MAG: CBS domain-containing protein [Rhodocyclales bacterium GWA2_65_20]